MRGAPWTPPRWLAPVVITVAVLPAVWTVFALISDFFWNTRYLGADPIEYLELSTGEWALRFLAVTLLITPLRQLTRANWLQKYRRSFGLITFTYAAMHLATYAGLDIQFYWPTLRDDFTKRPYIIVGALAFGTLVPRRQRALLSFLMWTANSACVVGIGLMPWFEGALALQALRGLFIGFGIAIWETTLMEITPEHLLSRVISLDFFGSIGLMPVGFLLAAAVSDLATPGVIVTAGAAVGVALFASALAWPRARAIQ